MNRAYWEVLRTLLLLRLSILLDDLLRWLRHRWFAVAVLEGVIASTIWHYWDLTLPHLLAGWAIMVAIVAPVAWMLDRFSK